MSWTFGHFKRSATCVVILLWSLPASAVDRNNVSSKVLYKAVDQLSDYLRKDLPDIAQHTKKTAVINYTQSEELPTSIQHYLTKRLEQIAAADERFGIKFVQCVECSSLQAVVEGDEIFIRKGIADDAQLADVMDKLGIRKYSDVNLAYTGDELILQVSLVDQNKLVDWSAEYKTPYKAYEDSQWVFGAGLEVGSFQGGATLPAATGARVQVGQRLTGLGAVGVELGAFEAMPGVPQIANFGTFVAISHNELFNQYWEFARLYYQLGLGVTDFNGTELINENIGVKAVMGQYYSIGIFARMHQFVQTPDDDTPIENPDGKPLLKNNEPLPMMVSLVLGVEIL